MMFYRQCGECNERWEIGTASTCKCPDERNEPVTWKMGASGLGGIGVLVSPAPQQEAKDEPVKLRRGDILRCIETDELCTVWATSTSGKTLVKWKGNDFSSYTAEQIGELFWLEPKEKDEPYALEASMFSNDRMKVDPVTGNVSIGTPQRTWVGLTQDELNMIGDRMIMWNSHSLADIYVAIEAKLKEKNT